MINILMIEDEKDLLQDVSLWLKFEGFEVHTATNGEEGLRLFQSTHIDLILCDINMPIMDGFEVLTEIRSLPHNRNVPFLFLTAQSQPESLREGMRLGADDYITKPFEYNDLLAAIRSRLQKHSDAESIFFDKASHLMVNHVDNIRRNLVAYLEKQISPTLQALRLYTNNISGVQGLNHNSQDITQHLHQVTSAIDYLHARMMPDSLISLGPIALIQWLTVQYEHMFKLKIQFQHSEVNRTLSANLLCHLFYMLDELLNNIVQHAKVLEAQIHLQVVDNTLYCSVSDRGNGFDVNKYWQNISSLGLVIVHERCKMLGGELDISSDIGKGTTANISISIEGNTQSTNTASPVLHRFDFAQQATDVSASTANRESISVVLAHHSSLLLRGINQVIAIETDIVPVATSENLKALFNIIEDGLQFDILILSLEMAQRLSEEQIKILSEHDSYTIVLNEANHDIPENLMHIARGFVNEEETVNNLGKVIRTVNDGKTYRMQMQHVVEDDETTVLEVLTQREREILEYVANNYQNAEIADKLFISIRTVETHRANMMRKLNLKNKSELIMFALKNGVISLES